MSDPEPLPRLTSVVPFLYGVADRSWLPGTVLTRLLTDVDATEEDAHAALARMRANGSLSSERRGRESDYQLAGLTRVAAKRARVVTSPSRVKEKKQPVWDGAFAGLLHAVPRSERPARSRLRRAARLAGYAPLRPGLMIGFRNVWTVLSEVVAELPSSVTVAPVTLGMKPGDARQAATEAWRLDRAATKITGIAEQLEEAATQPFDETGAAALRSYVRLALPAYRVFVKIPPLPPQLTPEDWPVPRMITALDAIRSTLGVAAEAYAGELLASARPDDSAEPAPVGD